MTYGCKKKKKKLLKADVALYRVCRFLFVISEIGKKILLDETKSGTPLKLTVDIPFEIIYRRPRLECNFYLVTYVWIRLDLFVLFYERRNGPNSWFKSVILNLRVSK